MPAEFTTTTTRITAREAAHRSGVSIATVRRRISDGRLPAIKAGKSYWVFPEDADRAFGPTPVVPQKAAPEALEAAIARAIAAAPPLSLAAQDRIISLLGGASA